VFLMTLTTEQRLAPGGRRRKLRRRGAAVLAAGFAGLLALVVTGAGGNASAAVRTTSAPAAAAQPSAVPAAPAGFTTTWSDDFNGAANTGIDSAWKYDTGAGSTFGTGEIETMTNSTSNVYQDGQGHLVLKALHSGTNPTSGWTSGRVETQAATFGAPAGGVVEMASSIQQPDLTTANGAGYWPAFWMLGSTLRTGTAWPGSGEVDILEDINSRSSVFGTLHCGVNPGGPCNESTGIGSGEHACSGCQTGFHTYAVQIDRSVSPEQIRWYLDGTNYFTVKSNQVDATTWANAVDHPFFIIYDLAMGGGFPAAFGGGPNASTASGGQLKVDWVAVYNKAPGGGSTTTGGSTTGGSTTGGSTTGGSSGGTTTTGDYTAGVTRLNATQAQVSFKPTTAAKYVIVHYLVNNANQQNVTMTNNGGTWTQTISGLSAGSVLTYWFTYEKNGPQYDSPQYTYTQT
jgi:hypothetical protein